MRVQTTVITALSAMALLTPACSKAQSKTSATKEPGAAVAKREIPARQPEEWLVVNETDYIPVVDALAERLSAAKKAFVTKDWKTSADRLRAAAECLDKEAASASHSKRLRVSAAAQTLRHVAGSVEAGKTPVMVLDGAIAKAHRAELEHDWLVTDTTSWFPYVNEPNVHFQSAHSSFLKKDHTNAAKEIRKAIAFVRMEEGSAVSKAKADLSASERDLDRLAADVESGTVQDVRNLENAFARASERLALSHQIKAARAWDKKEVAKAEREISAGAKHAEDAGAWVGTEASNAAAASIRDSRLMSAKLASGSGYAIEEVGAAITGLGKTITDLDRRIQPGKAPRTTTMLRDER